VLERFWGWRGASLAFAIVFAVLALAVQLTLGRDPAPSSVDRRAGTAEPERHGRLDPFVWRLAVFALLMGTAGGAVGRFFPLYAEEALDFSLATAGLLTAIGGLLGMVARVLVGRWAEERIAPTRLLGILALVGTSYCLLLAFITLATRGLLFLSPPLTAVGIAAWNAVAMLAIIMFVPTSQSGRASGIVMLGFLGGLTISAPLAGAAVDAWGDYQPVWLAAAALTLAAATMMLVGRAGRRGGGNAARPTH
jgi:predicted MFS family arabinose efflux permease